MSRKTAPDLSPEAVRSRLRQLVEDSGRPAAAVAEDAGMLRGQLHQVLVGFRPNPSVGTVGRVLTALSKTWRDLDT